MRAALAELVEETMLDFERRFAVLESHINERLRRHWRGPNPSGYLSTIEQARP
jgi:hypothetical protein